jgi:O-antigen ligase
MQSMSALSKVGLLILIVVASLLSGIMTTRFAILYARQLDEPVFIKNLVGGWIFPLILIAMSCGLRNSIPKLFILTMSTFLILMLSWRSLTELYNDQPIPGMGEIYLEIMVLLCVTLPLLLAAHGCELLRAMSSPRKRTRTASPKN